MSDSYHNIPPACRKVCKECVQMTTEMKGKSYRELQETLYDTSRQLFEIHNQLTESTKEFERERQQREQKIHRDRLELERKLEELAEHERTLERLGDYGT